jgi:MoxR-vWA-beta-propeller ternary system protein
MGCIGNLPRKKLREQRAGEFGTRVERALQFSRVENLSGVREVYQELRGTIRRVIVGKDEVVDLCLISLLAGGHVLLTDVPGVGKTTLAKAIATSITAEFSRGTVHARPITLGHGATAEGVIREILESVTPPV